MTQSRQQDQPLTPANAWQPFTPRGVAAFANATFTRLLLVQIVVAASVALTCIWFVSSQWFPVVTEAIHRLPPQGEIRRGSLMTPLQDTTRLAENRKLALVVDVPGSGTAGKVSDIEVVFESARVKVCGIAGCIVTPYPRGYITSFNREELEPWWGAWRWAVAAAIGIVVLVKLVAGWWALSIVLTPIVKLIAFFADREVTWAGSFRVGAAALLPGALIVMAGVALYGFGAVDPLRLALIYALHLLCGCVFIGTSPSFLQQTPAAVRLKNPFGGANGTGGRGAASSGKNPFSNDKRH